MIEAARSELDFLSNEPAEGEFLAHKLVRGTLSPEEALQYAVAIGEGLTRAHARGLVHGRFSPYSVAIGAKGARILQPTEASAGRCAPYRSPEQVRGEDPDSRSDIFAYGALLYEMASGKRAFSGTGEELSREILEKSPPALNAKEPILAAMERVVAGCLEKDPAKRRQRIQNAVSELRLESRKRPALRAARVRAALPIRQPEQPVPRNVPARPLPVRLGLSFWVIGFGFLLLATAGVAAVLHFLQTPESAPVFSFPVVPPPHIEYPGPPAISPDGRYLTFSAAAADGKRMLWLRRLDTLRLAAIPGTEGASAPFWSPNSEFVGFFANNLMKRVAIGGGPAQAICRAESTAGGGAWNTDGTILFAPGLSDGLYRVPENGGTPEAALKPDPAKSEVAFLWPQFLPDRKHVLFFVLTETQPSTGVYAGTVSPPRYQRLFQSENHAVYAPPAEGDSPKDGNLLFVRGSNLMRQTFDPASLDVKGAPVAWKDNIAPIGSLSFSPISVSSTGTLAYQTIAKATRQLVWVDRSGKPISPAQDGEWGPPRISPDGTRAVVGKVGPDDRHADLWLVDAHGGATRLTDTPDVLESAPVWSPDGLHLVYARDRQGNQDLCVKLLAGGEPEPLVRSEFSKHADDWSRDGRYVLFTVFHQAGTREDVWGVNTKDRRAGPILASVSREAYPALSPDGQWLAYQSNESGKFEVYVQVFDGITQASQRRWRVSSAGGGLPRWRADGKELFYLNPGGRMMEVPVHPNGANFEFDVPQPLFQTPSMPGMVNLFDVSPDGQRFLMNLPLEFGDAASIDVVTNWTREPKN